MAAIKQLVVVDEDAVGDILARQGAKKVSDLPEESYADVLQAVADALAA